MTEITNHNVAQLATLLGMDPVDAVTEALSDAGIECSVEWRSGSMAKVVAGWVWIAVERGTCQILRDCPAVKDTGHGAARLPSHPLYPSPITNGDVLAVEAALNIA